MDNSCCCMAKTKAILQSNYPSIKNKLIFLSCWPGRQSSEGLIAVGVSAPRLTHMAVGWRSQFMDLSLVMLMLWHLASSRASNLREKGHQDENCNAFLYPNQEVTCYQLCCILVVTQINPGVM